MQLEDGTTTQNNSNTNGLGIKDLAVCSVPNLLDITRLRSRETRSIFSAAIEDVELIREYYTESMYNQGIRGGMSEPVELAYSYDWLGRETIPMTTVEAGLGYVDDRMDRRMDRYISTSENQPNVGTKQSDMEAFDASSNLFPWIVDRRSREAQWYVSHQNGRTEGPDKTPLPAEKLYTAAWTVSWGDVLPYFPPLRVYGDGAPLTMGDSLGPAYNGREDPTPMSAVTDNPNRTARFINPYPDVAQPGVALISAVAPIYYTGLFAGFQYNDTYIGAAGVDIALASVSSVFGDLENSLTDGSFAFLVDTKSFSVIAISQSVVEKIYPLRTGMEEERPEDRRNQTYLVSDTIFQPLIKDGESAVESADWQYLHDAVNVAGMGERSFVEMNITETGSTEPQEFYVAFDRWQYVSDWTLLVFAPKEYIDHAVYPTVNQNVFTFPEVQIDSSAHGTIELTNAGYLDFRVLTMGDKNPIWIEFDDPEQVTGDGTVLSPGESVNISFTIDAANLDVGNSTSSVSFSIIDDEYPDCFFNEGLSVLVSIMVVPYPQLNQLGAIRIVGYVLATVIFFLAIYCVWWVYVYRKERVVRASQPLFLVTIAFGSFLMAATIIPLSVDDGMASERGCDIACMAAPWLFSVGFVTSFAALFSKLWRINKIFQSNRFQRVKVTEKDVLVPFAVLFVLNFAFLLAWTIWDPLVWDRKQADDFNNSYGRCIGHGVAHIYLLSAIVIVDVIALVLACHQAFMARGISDEYSETKFIAIAVGGWLQVVLIGVPLMFLVAGNPTADFFIKTCIIFAITLAMLLLIFVPKMLHEHNRDSTVSKRATQSAEVQRIMARATAYATAAASAPANLETYRVSSLSNTNSQNSEVEASTEMSRMNSSQSSISDGMGFRIIGSIETDQKKLTEVQDENKVLKRQLKREQREVERLKTLLTECRGDRNVTRPQPFLTPDVERFTGAADGSQRQGNLNGSSLLRVTFFDETKTGSLPMTDTVDMDMHPSPPTPKRRLSPDRDFVEELMINSADMADLTSPVVENLSEEENEDSSCENGYGAEYEESVKGPPDDQV
ncbi:7 transmembrane sweet-taste receptor of 3 GCPR [Nitzschia inconspicua]|uniref:7 transmembrane sweet-taste receptor of 3 GCPR n=1 Tax=Nitzschia inconspicua TaxID=303405 RepID=A0A9K3KFW5_9STRA|nr:7 transmembrane sweet-taste receptor of 3 GCPR [Nitzschia inconspicua]